VLKHLVGVNDVEGAVGEVERLHVADDVVDVGAAAAGDPGPGQGQCGLADLERRDAPWCDPLREVCRDGPGAAADVEEG
jgi:hypothetical protein